MAEISAEQFGKMEHAIEMLVQDVHDIKDFINGNGKAGVKSRLDALESDRERRGKAAETGWRTFIQPAVTVIITLIVSAVFSACQYRPLATAENRDATSIAVIQTQEDTETPTATARPTETPTPTSSIVERQETNTPTPSIIEVTPRPLCVLAPGKFCPERGTYIPYRDQGICVGPGCKLYVGLWPAGKPMQTQATTQEGRNEVWVCMFYKAPVECKSNEPQCKPDPAEYCMQALLWFGPAGMNGKYITQ